MKSWRLKSVALTWLQGGHHTAPQYRNSGLWSVLAATNAASTSSLRQAMPSSWTDAGAFEAATLVSPAAGAAAEGALGGSGDGEHAPSANVRVGTSRNKRGFMAMGNARIDHASVSLPSVYR